MGRPRAGHGWTWIYNNGRPIHLIQNDAGQWITTGEAQGWKRCPRCRRPFENSPFDSGLCHICYFYRSGLPIDQFWKLHSEGYWLAPYNIGRRCMKNIAFLHNEMLRSSNWRKALKTQSRIDTITHTTPASA